MNTATETVNQGSVCIYNLKNGLVKTICHHGQKRSMSGFFIKESGVQVLCAPLVFSDTEGGPSCAHLRLQSLSLATTLVTGVATLFALSEHLKIWKPFVKEQPSSSMKGWWQLRV